MKLNDALRYYELTGGDFLADIEQFSKYNAAAKEGYIYDNFTEVYEQFIGRLLKLSLDRGLRLDAKALVEKYCSGIPSVSTEKKTKTFEIELTDSSLRKSKKKQNQVIEIVTMLIASETDISQFYDLELELIIQIINQVSARKKAQQEKAKRKRKGGF